MGRIARCEQSRLFESGAVEISRLDLKDIKAIRMTTLKKPEHLEKQRTHLQRRKISAAMKVIILVIEDQFSNVANT